MTTINLTVTVEINDDLSPEEVSALASELVFGVSRGARDEIKSVVRNGKAGLAAEINVKVAGA
jgi:hypothetical protein